MSEYKLFVLQNDRAAIFSYYAARRNHIIFKESYDLPDIWTSVPFMGGNFHIMKRSTFFQRLILHEVLMDIVPHNFNISAVSELTKSEIRACVSSLKKSGRIKCS